MAEVLGHLIPDEMLTKDEKAYLAPYAVRDMTVSDIWRLMDDEWKRLGVNFHNEAALAAFYRSPIWLLNGIFVEGDHESSLHRVAITDWIGLLRPDSVTDYGGGLGALARQIAAKLPDCAVTVVERFPHRVGLHLAEQFQNLRYSDSLPTNSRIVVAQDVLEHVTDPLDLFGRLAASTALGGYLITANCFKPVIKCHFPGAFHFNFTFRFVATALGCKYVGAVPGASHAQIFRRGGHTMNWSKARRLERHSVAIYPILQALSHLRRRLL